LEAIEEGFLAAEDFFAGGGEVEPGAAVGFGDFDLAAGARGPFDEAGVGDESGGIEVAFDCPGGDLLAGRLGDHAEGEEFAFDESAGFFLEFATGGGEGFLVGEVLAFGNGPGVFFGPEGAAGMDEEDFETVNPGPRIETWASWISAIEEDAGGGFGHDQGTGYR
jgi:hypothetical protein